jgi:hypothetical protein
VRLDKNVEIVATMRTQHKKRYKFKEASTAGESFVGAASNEINSTGPIVTTDEIKYTEQDLAQVRHVFRDFAIVIIALIVVGSFFGAVLFYDGRTDVFRKLSDSASRAAGLIK